MDRQNGLHRNTGLSAVVEEDDADDRRILWKEWLDTFYLSDRDRQQEMLQEHPPVTGTEWDVIVAAGVCWLARKAGLVIPSWTQGRVLQHPYRGSVKPGSPLARIEQIMAPPEFFERNIFISASIMYRARMPVEWIENEPKAFTRLVQKLIESGDI